jgi:hypothetical protein
MAQTRLPVYSPISSRRESMRVSKKFVMGSAALGAVFLLALTAGATAQDSSSPRDKLAVWAGRWKRHGEVKETQFGHARTFDYDVQCSFLPHAAFMACSSLSLMPDPNHGNRISNGANLFYYSDVDKTFKYTEVHPEGGPREGTALVDGNVWTEPMQIQRRSGGMADAHFIYNFVSPGKIQVRFEISTDKGAHWTVVDEFVDTKEG